MQAMKRTLVLDQGEKKTAKNMTESNHTINFDQTDAQGFFPDECLRRYPSLPERRVVEGPDGVRDAFFFSSSAPEPASVDAVPAGGRQSTTYEICRAASHGRSARSSRTGSATSASNRYAHRPSRTTGWT